MNASFRFRLGLVAGLLLTASVAAAQPVVSAGNPPQAVIDRVVCPGDPAGNLASLNCEFSRGKRFEQFATGGLTDGALLGAAAFAELSQLRGAAPTEWQGWSGYGDRVLTNHAQNLTKQATAYAVGAALRDDPRHIRCDSDRKNADCSLSGRIGHVFVDWATVRKSRANGHGPRIPNAGLFAGAVTGATIGNLWYPPSGRTASEVGWRIGGSLATALAASAWTEFQPEIGAGVGAVAKAIFRTGTKPGGAQ